MKKKGKGPSYTEVLPQDDYPLLDLIMPLREFEELTERDKRVSCDCLKVVRALLNGEINLNDYQLWLLELEKKYPGIKPLSFFEAASLLRKQKRFKMVENYKGVMSF